MNVACEKSSFKSSGQSIDNDAERDEKACGIYIHSGESIHHSGAAKQEHRRHYDVCRQTKHQEYYMCRGSPTNSNENMQNQINLKLDYTLE